MNEAVLIIEAKDLAAEKMASGHKNKKKKKEEEYEDMVEVSKLKELLDNWPDKEHQYYKDLENLLDSDEEEEEEEMEY